MDADELTEAFKQGIRLPAAPAAAPDADRPTLRDRWRKTMFFGRVDRIPNFEFGYWAETLEAWREQGLPPHVVDEASAYRYFGIENWAGAPINVMGLEPKFPYEVVAETDGLLTYRDHEGVTAQINKRGHKSIPHYIDFRLKTRADWEEFKARLQPGPHRVAANWAESVPAMNARDYPLAVGRGSLIGTPRNWIGFENIALMIYDDPELLEEIVEHLCVLICDSLARVLPDVEFDFASGWEDICFNSGPIVGVNFMRDVVAPRYKRISDLLARHGCLISWTDCDGNIMPILDALWAGGFNCCFPVEVNGGSDPVEIRRRYPDMRLQGGFCKMMLPRGKDAIRAEIERIRPVVREGGFLPGVDHRVQADAPLSMYKYYLKLKRDRLGAGGVPEYDESAV